MTLWQASVTVGLEAFPKRCTEPVGEMSAQHFAEIFAETGRTGP
jgi:hypothetical protein